MNTQQTDGITLSATGAPFATEDEARAMMKKRGMDAKKFVIIPYPLGKETFAIGNVEILVAPREESAPAEPANGRRRYWKLQFHEKTDPNATDKVELTHNGDTLIWERGIPVIVPETHRHVADCAVHNIYKQVPGEDRKVESVVRTYPYQLFGEATEAEYLALLKTGNEIRDRAIEHNRAQSM